MPFGLCNAPATFERLMDRVFQGLRWNRCLVYLDDIISFGGTYSAALSNLTLIFERLRSYGLQLKSSKCHLFRASVPFLGHIVGRRGLECDPKKIEDVKSWPVPDCLKSVRQFLGFVGYYRRFIPKFADIATPLVHLTGKDVPFVWDTSCSAAFQALRASLIDAPILAFPTETGQYILDTDASNFGLGGVLSQIQNDQERVVAYCSRALRPSQRRYCTTKREMLAVVAMCIQFRSYLRGARFTLRTDHKSLVWLHRFKDTEGMLSRWLHSLQQFQFSIIHRPGKDHGVEWFGSRQFFDQRQNASQALWMDMALARRSGQELRNSYVITNSPEYAPLRRFFKVAVDALQMVFDRSLVTSVQPRSLISQMQEAVADCDDGSSDGSMMLLSLPHDIPEVKFPVDSSRDLETRDEVTPVVISRRLTPANRPLQLLEAGQLGASAPQHVPSCPAVPDLCIASSGLLSALDPLPLDRITHHTVEEISLWPAADRHAILAVAHRDVRVARQNIAELMLYVDDHAAHLANCASANDDSLTLMSAELLPRLEGGIRAVLDETDNM